ncbi:hypothetical protein Pyn_24475 [Prunus yedoensis var. nudiflora]|uniref:Uncharacterized protein n=1 Tax=Prunus yedoensis var. nudiflora TaxID=2094558 RepID=A0A314YS31_PRUYE|nr:hypothetical protein Pyn_24475 [Prunus yedoensis var. nudiflora]
MAAFCNRPGHTNIWPHFAKDPAASSSSPGTPKPGCPVSFRAQLYILAVPQLPLGAQLHLVAAL